MTHLRSLYLTIRVFLDSGRWLAKVAHDRRGASLGRAVDVLRGVHVHGAHEDPELTCLQAIFLDPAHVLRLQLAAKLSACTLKADGSSERLQMAAAATDLLLSAGGVTTRLGAGAHPLGGWPSGQQSPYR